MERWPISYLNAAPAMKREGGSAPSLIPALRGKRTGEGKEIEYGVCLRRKVNWLEPRKASGVSREGGKKKKKKKSQNLQGGISND